MDKNIETIINEFREAVGESIYTLHAIEKYYSGFKKMEKDDWYKAEAYQPEDDATVLVSWYLDGNYQGPYRAFWDVGDQAFYPVDSLISYPMQVEIWCKIPEFPEHRL